MGKHERKSIDEAEQIIKKLLNSEKLSNNDFNNHWFRHAVAIAKKIKNDFKDYTHAEHLGSRYDTIGDIKLNLPKNRSIFIETKMSDTASGIGTKANISQNALTENLLFYGNVRSQSKFREDRNHEQWVYGYLNEFTKYPDYLENIDNLTKQKEEKARFLRKLKNKNKKAKELLDYIREKDRKEKLDYLGYLKNKKQSPEMINRFLTLIMLGIHTQKDISNLIQSKNFSGEIKNLYIYYANYSGSNILVRKENAREKVGELLGKYNKFKIIFPENLTHCKVVGIKNKKETPLLQIVLHWKNIAQGIKTPCLNIFDLN